MAGRGPSLAARSLGARGVAATAMEAAAAAAREALAPAIGASGLPTTAGCHSEASARREAIMGHGSSSSNVSKRSCTKLGASEVATEQMSQSSDAWPGIARPGKRRDGDEAKVCALSSPSILNPPPSISNFLYSSLVKHAPRWLFQDEPSLSEEQLAEGLRGPVFEATFLICTFIIMYDRDVM